MRDVLDTDINVLAQLVSETPGEGATLLSLSCNPDLTLDLVRSAQPRTAARKSRCPPAGHVLA